MDLTNVDKSQPIEPYIECDGWYARCHRCWTEINPDNEVCPNCQQAQDWSWFKKSGKSFQKLLTYSLGCGTIIKY